MGEETLGKSCIKCGLTKPLNQFGFRKDRGIYRRECEKCRSMQCAATRYGIKVSDVLDLLQKQNNKCAICGVEASQIVHKTFTLSPLVIDHCHTTGKVRGLLCPNCNILIGQAHDSITVLSNAIQYLSQ